jgi:hypothetical protein
MGKNYTKTIETLQSRRLQCGSGLSAATPPQAQFHFHGRRDLLVKRILLIPYVILYRRFVPPHLNPLPRFGGEVGGSCLADQSYNAG